MTRLTLACFALLVAAAGCGSNPFAPIAERARVVEGVRIYEDDAGSGIAAAPGDLVTIHYTIAIDNNRKHPVDSSFDRGQPFSFVLGTGQVIRGFDIGIEGMRVGGHRYLEIPPDKAYGAQGAGDRIPPNATLSVTIEMIEIQPPPSQP